MQADVPAGRCTGEAALLRWNAEELKRLLRHHGLCHEPGGSCFLPAIISAIEEHRDPSVTELRVIDTYWSDHCRHTTFSTRLQNH